MRKNKLSSYSYTSKLAHSTWTPSIAAKKSGESCDDGNCLTDLNLHLLRDKLFDFR